MSIAFARAMSFGTSNAGLSGLKGQPRNADDTANGAQIALTSVDKTRGVYAISGTLPNGSERLDVYRSDGTTYLGTANEVSGVTLPTTPPAGYGPGAAGGGARTVTITVNDGTTALQNAQVRLTEGVNTQTGETDASGQVVLNADDATYTVAITKAGYSFSGASLVVSADVSHTYSMIAVVIPPAADPSTTNAYTTCRDIHGAVESGVVINFRLVTPPGSIDAWQGRNKRATSDVNGLVQMTLPQSASCEVWRNDGEHIAFETGTESTLELPQTISRKGS